jgi:biopolymer transport protein ExbB
MLFGLTEAALTAGVAALLWVLSASSWVVIVYKTWWIWRAGQDLPAAQHAYWQTPDPVQAQQALALLDRHGLLQALARSAALPSTTIPPTPTMPTVNEDPAVSSWGAPQTDDPHALSIDSAQQRQMVQALRRATQQVQWGQPWLACVASVAPFLGLLGTVWGLLDVLATLPGSAPGEWENWLPTLSHTLHLTAVGLCVAVPALLAHHVMSPRLMALQQSIEDFAAELLEHPHRGCLA